jgi:hypothetical protein
VGVGDCCPGSLLFLFSELPDISVIARTVALDDGEEGPFDRTSFRNQGTRTRLHPLEHGFFDVV